MSQDDLKFECCNSHVSCIILINIGFRVLSSRALITWALKLLQISVLRVQSGTGQHCQNGSYREAARNVASKLQRMIDQVYEH